MKTANKGILRGACKKQALASGFHKLPTECFVSVFIFLFAASFPLAAQTVSKEQLAQITFDQKLNSQVSPDLPFRDESGRHVALREFFGTKPMILVLGYYECPMLCTLTLNGMVQSLQEMKWSAGREFQIVNVSIDPRETPALAAAKKRSYLKRYGRTGAEAGWHFLTGDESAIRQLANEVGFHYAYDAASKQFAHPSGLVILTPQGKVSGYLFGVTYDARELFASVQTAAKEQAGSPIQRLVLLCFHYNPLTGKYSGVIIVTLRIISVAILAGLVWLIVALARGIKRSTPVPIPQNHPAEPCPEVVAPVSDHARQAGL